MQRFGVYIVERRKKLIWLCFTLLSILYVSELMWVNINVNVRDGNWASCPDVGSSIPHHSVHAWFGIVPCPWPPKVRNLLMK